MAKLEERLKKNQFTLEDFLMQFEQIGKMGNIADLMAMVPGMAGKFNPADIDESKIDKFKAIIRSMTTKERQNPEIINGSRRKRIAAGSGSTIQEVNSLLKQYEQTKLLMKNANNGKLAKMFGRRF